MSKAVLIVDDDPSIREMMDVILTQAGFRVSATSNGEAALDLLKRSRFALVVLDIHMPRMSGLDVLAVMEKLSGMPPVLMVTANSAPDTVREAVGLGCSGYLAKPFSPAALVARVRHALSPPSKALMIG
ncbi:MAG: response regulator [Pseudomonadota bacterium]